MNLRLDNICCTETVEQPIAKYTTRYVKVKKITIFVKPGGTLSARLVQPIITIAWLEV